MVSPGRDEYFMKESDPKDIGIRKGTLTLPDGSEYFGDLRDSIPNGQGTCKYLN